MNIVKCHSSSYCRVNISSKSSKEEHYVISPKALHINTKDIVISHTHALAFVYYFIDVFDVRTSNIVYQLRPDVVTSEVTEHFIFQNIVHII